MSFSGLIAVLTLAAGAVFALLNQSLLAEPRAVVVPGATFSVPLIGILLGTAAAAIVLMLLGEAGAAASWRMSKAKLSRRIYERDREVLELKARLSAHTTIRETTREEPDRAAVHRETTVTRRG